MTTRVTVRVDTSLPGAERVRLWCLQAGAEVTDEHGHPQAPQHGDVSREEVVAFVRHLQGRSSDDRGDAHNSGQAWPRGTFGGW